MTATADDAAALFAAIETEDLETLGRLAAQHVLTRDQDGRTPLIFAAECGSLAAIKALLEHGAALLDVDEVRRESLALRCLGGARDAACVAMRHRAGTRGMRKCPLGSARSRD